MQNPYLHALQQCFGRWIWFTVRVLISIEREEPLQRMHVRYQARVPNHRGILPGVFGFANALAHEGKLSDAEWAAWRSGNDWFNAAYPDPAASNPDVYNPQVNPSAAAWFKDTATHLLERVEPYLGLLERHGVEVVRLVSDDPGRIIYEDTVQIVVVPHESTN